MSNKFNRNYLLSVHKIDGSQLDIEPPFTIEFDITRNVLTSANVCSIRIYNLSENNRNQIRKNICNYGDFRTVRLRAGYGENIPIIFVGNITQAWSAREGVNFITSIECFDGGFAFANSLTSKTYPSGTSQANILSDLMKNLPGVSLGAVGSYPGQISRGNAYSGSTVNLLNELSGGGFFVDNGKANCLGNSECLKGDLVLINSDSGLLGTPVLERDILNFDMIFEPRLMVGQKIRLESSTDKNFRNDWKVISLKHRGMISESVCGEVITSVGLYTGTQLLTVVTNATDNRAVGT
jgi:hypothetical protein